MLELLELVPDSLRSKLLELVVAVVERSHGNDFIFLKNCGISDRIMYSPNGSWKENQETMEQKLFRMT